MNVSEAGLEGAPALPAAGARGPTVGTRALLVLLVLLVAINAASIWSLLAARQGTRRLALEDLDWQTRAHARALEAALAGLRGDFILLSQTPPLAQSPALLAASDPLIRRWGRLEVEGTLLLFLKAHPAVERLMLTDAAGTPLAVAGRRAGAPVLLAIEEPPDTEPVGSAPAGMKLVTRWPLDSAGALAGGTLETVIDPAALLASTVPGFGPRLALELGAAIAASSTPDAGQLVARTAVREQGFQPPVAWTLVRREEESALLASVETLTGRLGTTVAINLAVLALAYALALVAFRQVRHAARLAAENEHQARLAVLERQVAASERLASVGRLASGLAHEINNPLEGMSNYLRLLEEDLAAGDTREASQLAAKVRHGLERIAGITRQVLTFASRGQAPKEEVDLAEVLERNLELLRATPEYRALRLELDRPAGPVVAYGNPITLHQLFLNLLLNACQMQPKGGAVEVSCRGNDTRARVTVADRGPGLSPEALAHAFEPFYSTRGSSGLGLTVSKGIVDDHHGSIRVSNRAQGGALFEIELPRHPVEGALVMEVGR